MMNFDAVKQVIDMDTETGSTMAGLVCSVYRPDHYPFGVGNIDHFDSKNYRIALDVIGYRRETGWSDSNFFKLFQYAMARVESDNCSDENSPGATTRPI